LLKAKSDGQEAGGSVVIVLTHPCFRVPRQSGWGWDQGRSLVYRRLDRYMTPLAVPFKEYTINADEDSSSSQKKVHYIRSFHRPLSQYVNVMAQYGLLVTHMEECPGPHLSHLFDKQLQNQHLKKGPSNENPYKARKANIAKAFGENKNKSNEEKDRKIEISREENLAREEIPLFLALRAIKVSPPKKQK